MTSSFAPVFRRAAVAALTLLVGTAVAGQGQEWRGPVAIEVVVEDNRGKDVPGAEVRLVYLAPSGGGVLPSVVTDAGGKVAIGGLAAGRWMIEVRRDGLMTYRAEVALSADNRPSVLSAAQEMAPGATGTMRVKLNRAKGGAPLPVRETPAMAAPAPVARATSAPPAQRPAQIPAAAPPAPATVAKPVAPVAAPAPVTPAAPQSTPAASPPTPAAPVGPPTRSAPVPASPPASKPAAPAAAAPAASAPQPAPMAPVGPPTAAAPAPAPVPAAKPAAAVAAQPATPPSQPRPAIPNATPGTSVSPAPAVAPTPAPLPIAPAPVAPAKPTPAPTAAPVPPAVAAAAVSSPVPAAAAATVTGASVPATPAPARQRICVECAPGESAQWGEVIVEGGAGAGCPADLRQRLDGVSLFGDAGFAALNAALEPGCRAIRVELPAGARFTGFRYEASGGTVTADCLPGRDCPAGGARFPFEPVIRREGGRTILLVAFESTAAEARVAVVAAYFSFTRK